MAKATTINISTTAVDQLNEYLDELDMNIEKASNITEEIATLNEKLGAHKVLLLLGIYISERKRGIEFVGRYCGDILDGIDD